MCFFTNSATHAVSLWWNGACKGCMSVAAERMWWGSAEREGLTSWFVGKREVCCEAFWDVSTNRKGSGHE